MFPAGSVIAITMYDLDGAPEYCRAAHSDELHVLQDASAPYVGSELNAGVSVDANAGTFESMLSDAAPPCGSDSAVGRRGSARRAILLCAVGWVHRGAVRG